jgi:hypothetical protein
VSIWDSYFGFPDGQVWPNLVASLIWGLPSLAGSLAAILHVLRKHHGKHHSAISDVHDLVSSLHSRLDSMERRQNPPTTGGAHDSSVP